jgi:hypothetical protein
MRARHRLASVVGGVLLVCRRVWRAHATRSSRPQGGLQVTEELPAEDLVRGPDGAIWFAAIELVGRIRRERSGQDVAPAWFTQRGFDHDAADGIGRLTTEGRYTSWPLPRRRAAPLRIVPGPDGALWFTEQDAHAIGRITTDGQIT